MNISIIASNQNMFVYKKNIALGRFELKKKYFPTVGTIKYKTAYRDWVTKLR
jgi:hypothetical protein